MSEILSNNKEESGRSLLNLKALEGGKSSSLNCPLVPQPTTSKDTSDYEVSEDWRDTHLTWSEQLKFLYDNKDPSGRLLDKDISFLVGEGENSTLVKAHHFVLQCKSIVFYKLLQNKFSEALQGEAHRDEHGLMVWDLKPILIPYVEAKPFQRLIKFAYTETIETDTLGVEETIQLLQAAKKFQFKLLKIRCLEHLSKLINIENAISVCKLADELDDEEVMQISLPVLLNNGEAILKSDQFVTVSHKFLCRILQSNDLKALEIDVFQAALRWVVNQCKNELHIPCSSENLRETLHTAHTLIRFPLMHFDTILNTVQPLGLLSDTEMLEITSYLLSRNENSLKTFSNENRLGIYENNQTIRSISPVSPDNKQATAEVDIFSSKDKICYPTISLVKITPKPPSSKSSSSSTVKRNHEKKYSLCFAEEKPTIHSIQNIKDLLINQMKHQNFNDFEEVDSIRLENVFIKKARRCARFSNSIEDIIVSNLKEYEILINTEIKKSSIPEINIEDYLVVKCKATTPAQISSQLWNQECKISLWEKSTRRFEINPNDGTLTVNFESDDETIPEKILKKCSKHSKLKKLAILNCKLDSFISSVNVNLTKLVLHRVRVDNGDQFKKFLQNCKQLNTFCWTGCGKSTIDLSRDLKNSSKTLRHLALCNLMICCSRTIVFTILSFIHLELCDCSSEIDKKITSIAPKLKNIWICAHHRYFPTDIFTGNLLKMEKLEKISVSYVDYVIKCNFRENESIRLINFLNSSPFVIYNPCKLKISKEGFSLIRANAGWNFSSFNDETIMRSRLQYFDSFKLALFYKDFAAHQRDAKYLCKHRNCKGITFIGNVEELCLHEQRLDLLGNLHNCTENDGFFENEVKKASTKHQKSKATYEMDPDYDQRDNDSSEEERSSSESQESSTESSSESSPSPKRLRKKYRYKDNFDDSSSSSSSSSF